VILITLIDELALLRHRQLHRISEPTAGILFSVALLESIKCVVRCAIW